MKLKIVLFAMVMAYLPQVMAAQFKVLLFTKTEGWHHKSINAGVTAFEKMAALHDFDLEWHEDPSRINDENLKQFDVIVFLSTSGDILNDKQKAAMENFIQSGKGFVGVHSASDTEYNWPWYMKLVGRSFVAHPNIQTAKMSVIDRSFPGLEHMADTIPWTDEWYEYSKEYTEGLNYILSVDESTYRLDADWHKVKATGMGKFHPVSWYHNYDGGRSFYTGLGHIGATYSSTLFLEHLYGGVFWAATGKGLYK